MTEEFLPSQGQTLTHSAHIDPHINADENLE